MTKTFDARHHAVHPPSKVAPNLAVNPKPNYVPPEKAALPNPNPSLGSVGVLDGLNARRPGPTPLSRRQDSEAVSNPDSPPTIQKATSTIQRWIRRAMSLMKIETMPRSKFPSQHKNSRRR